jgi:gliding motility-associated-like protein
MNGVMFTYILQLLMNYLRIACIVLGLIPFMGQLQATHIVGADLTYECTNPANNTYRIELTLYRDCTPASQADFDNSVTLFFFNGNTGREEFTRTINRRFTIPPKVIPRNGDACLSSTDLNSICVEYGKYEVFVNLPAIPGGYDIGWSRCCRNNSITNIRAGGQQSQGVSLLAHVPTDIAPCNSMPLFNQLAPIFLCANQPFAFDHSATDPDGDSLVYKVSHAYSGLNFQALGTTPRAPTVGFGNPLGPPPYQNVIYNAGFTFIDPFGSGNFQIDPQSGLLTLLPTTSGIFVFAISVCEYRNGVLLSENKRDFQINVKACTPQGNPPVISNNITVLTPVPNDSVYRDNGVIVVQPEREFCYEIDLSDPSANDVVELFPASAPFGIGGSLQPPFATLTQTGTNPVTGTVCWTPGCALAGQRIDIVVGGRDTTDCPGLNNVFSTLRIRIEGAHPPLLKHTLPGGGDTARIKVGQNFCYDYDASDEDPFDGIIVSARSGPFASLGNGTATLQDTGVNPIAGQVCWTPACEDADQMFMFELIARDTNYCNKSLPRLDTVWVFVDPLPEVTALDSAEVCFGSEVGLSASATEPGAFNWFPTVDMTNPNTANPQVLGTLSQNYFVTYTDPYGCLHVDSTWLTVIPLPNITMFPDAAEICEGDSVTLSIRAQGFDIVAVDWNPLNSLELQSIARVRAFPLTTTTYTTIVTDVTGCTDTADVTVTVNPLPVVDAGEDTVQCGNDPIQLNATGGIQYSWSPASSLQGANTNNPFADPDSSELYFVTVTDANGCASEDSVFVRAFNANAGPDIPVCIGDSTQLAALPGPIAFQWQADPGFYDRTDVPDPLVFTLNSRDYILTGTDTSGCTDTDTVRVIVNPLPTTTVTNPDLYVCSGAPTVLTATGGVQFAWTPAATLDDSTLASPTARPINQGTNIVDSTWYYVTVTDTNGCSSLDSIGIEVRIRPIIEVSNDTFVCPGDSVPIWTQGGFGVQRAGWRFDGTVGDTTLITVDRAEAIAFPTEGTYYVGVVEAIWGCTNEDSIWVYHIEPFAGEDSTICEGDSLRMLGAGGVRYRWTPPTGLSNASVAQPWAFPRTTTTYTLTVTDSLGCVDSAQATITVRPAPPVEITGDTEICINDTANLFANGGIAYQWITDDPTISSLTAPNVTATPIDDMRYVLVGEGTNGCFWRDTLDLPVYQLPNVDAGPPIVECRNVPVMLQGSGAVNYSWTDQQFLDDPFAPNPLATPDSTQYFYLEGIDENGCVNYDSVYFRVIQLPEVSVSPDDSICLFQNASFRARGIANSFFWSTGEETESITVAPDESTTYWVIGYNSEGCAADTLFVNLYVERDLPRAAFTPEITEGFPALEVPFINESQNASRFRWRYGNGDTSTNDLPVHSYTYFAEGQYTVWLVADNAIGCPDSVAYEIIDVWGEEFFLPTAFTPNGDGNNDEYYIPNGGFQTFEVQIFNRWGRLVYKSNDPNFRWNGRDAQGRSVPEGVYVINVTGRSWEGVQRKQNGTITVIR